MMRSSPPARRCDAAPGSVRDHKSTGQTVLLRQLADFAAGYLTKGRLVYVEGRFQGRTWQSVGWGFNPYRDCQSDDQAEHF